MGLPHVMLQAVAKNEMYNNGCQVTSFPQLHACNTEDTGEQKPDQSGREGGTVTPEARRSHGGEVLGVAGSQYSS